MATTLRERLRTPKILVLLGLVLLAACDTSAPPASEDSDLARWEARAERVEIVRDDWGVPHIYAPTDADAVFGLMYTQAEDDFNRVETNFLTSLGRMAEAEGESRIWQDLRMRLFIDPVELQGMYAESPQWLRDLMDGWADGLNYYLHTHPETEPMVLDRFEPWMALSFSEGSIGGDIERVSLGRLEDFYGDSEASLQRAAEMADDAADDAVVQRSRMAMASPAGSSGATWSSGLEKPDPYLEPVGSNGIAIAPEKTVDGNALLLINPHTSFFFRHEAHVVSDEGLNAYGALTWGQFFVYQGFNETAGWMHTSSSVDNIDEFAEDIVEQDDGLYYRYGDELRPVETEETTVSYVTEDGSMAERTFTTYRTHHGPIVRETEDGRWVATALMEEPMRALIQSYSRTKAANLDEYLEVMETHTNSSNNTLFADAEGNVAYLHSNFVPVRDTRFDYSNPVDGSDPATDWNGVHTLEESPNSINPSTGFAFCSNNWPYSASGEASPDPENFPAYMDRGSENYRGVHALRVLPGRTDFTLDGLVETAYSTQMPYFDENLPALFAAYDAMPAGAEKDELTSAIEMLRGWDMRWGVESIPTSIGVY
ncbi:MAG TPA: penicillin acylase family protein, partial [Longimicrobiales bacterium]|nr:penicillin acylase family protein [Longimicrobiales bacterium]